MPFDVEALSVGALLDVILSRHPITTPLPLLTSTDSTKTWEQCGERNLRSTSPCSSLNCPRNIVRSHYTGFRGWGTCVLAAIGGDSIPFTSRFPTPHCIGCGEREHGVLECTCCSEAPAVITVYLWLLSFYWVTAEVCAGWKMRLLKATFKCPQSKPSSLHMCQCPSTMKTWGKLTTGDQLVDLSDVFTPVWECLGYTVPTNSTIVSVVGRMSG